MKILIFSRYDFSQASTRVRFLQYFPFLKEEGFDVQIFPIIKNNGISGRKNIFFLVQSRLKSFYRVGKRLFMEKGKKTLILIHTELFPFLPFWLEYGYMLLLGKRNYVIEFDDAWFHRYDANKSWLVRMCLGRKIYSLMRHSVLVIAGNQYIADHAKFSGAKHVEIIPTVVDFEKYKRYLLVSKEKQTISSTSLEITQLKDPSFHKNRPIIGWIGSPATTKFLVDIKNVIKWFDHYEIANFVAFGADPNQLKDLPIKVIPWQEHLELEILYQFDIGIMPLTDSLFERGKCGYKLIQYMACGLPVVASPVGVNKSIVVPNETGYFASTDEDWIKYLTALSNNFDLRKRLGTNGQTRAEIYYSLKAITPKYLSIIKASLDSVLS